MLGWSGAGCKHEKQHFQESVSEGFQGSQAMGGDRQTDTSGQVDDRDHIHAPSLRVSQRLDDSCVSSFLLTIDMPCSGAPTLSSPWESVLSPTAWCSAQRDEVR